MNIFSELSEKITLRWITLIVVFILLSFNISAQNNWQGGAAGNWSVAANWSLGTVPTSADAVIISTKGAVVTVDISNAVCLSLQVGSSSNGTATLKFNSGSILTVSGIASIGDPGNTGRLGSIDMTNGGLLVCQALSLNNTGANTFIAGAGEVELTATNTLPATVFTSFNLLTLSGGTTTFSIPVTVDTLSLALGATMTQGANLITLSGDFINAGGTITANSGGLFLNGTGAQNLDTYSTTGTITCFKSAGTATFLGNISVANIAVNTAGGTLSLGSGTVHTVSGACTVSAGTLLGSSSTINFSNTAATPFVISGTGVFTANTSTIDYSGAGNQTIGATTYYNLILSTSGTKTIPATATFSNNLKITGTAIASLNTGTTYNVNTLQLGVYARTSGTWGGTGSGAMNINATFFAPTTGQVNVATDSRPVITITATGPDKPYGTALTAGSSASNFSVSGNTIAGEFITAVNLTPNAAGLLSSTVAGSAYTVTPSAASGTGGFLDSNYQITYVVFNGTVSKQIITIAGLSGVNKAYDGTTSATFTGTPSYNGLVNGETFSVVGTGTASFATASAANGKTVTITGFSAPSSNYTLTTPTLNANITKLTLTITVSNVPKPYGTTLTNPETVTSSSRFSFSGTIAGESVTSVIFTYTGANAATFITATATIGTQATASPGSPTGTGGFDFNNYTPSFTGKTLSVGQGAITITATGPSKQYGDALTAGSSTTNYTITGSLAPADAITSVTLTPDANGLSATTAVGATYTVTPSAAVTSGSLANYNVTYVALTGTVSPRFLTITATAQTKPYGGTAPVSGTLNTNYTLTGSFFGSDAISGVTLGYSGSPSGDLATANVGTYTITPSNAVFSSGSASNYAITYLTGTLTVNPANITVTASNQTRAYGLSSSTTGVLNSTFTISGLLNSDVANAVTLGYSGTPSGDQATATPGTYTITPSALTMTSGNASNYNITYNTGTLTISPGPASQFIISTVNSQTAGGAFPITVRVADQFGNITTASSAIGFELAMVSGTDTIIRSTGTPVGSIASGASSGTITNLLYYTAESGVSFLIRQTSGTPAITSDTSNTFTVLPGALSTFAITDTTGAEIPNQTAGIAFFIRITAQDLWDNIVTSFTGTVNITSSGTLTAGGGTTPVFVNGVLSSRSITINPGGTFTLTATRTSGTPSAFGISNNFIVGTTYYSQASGNWNGNIWSTNLAGPASTGVKPTVGDAVIIQNGHTVTVTATDSCKALTFSGGAGSALTVNNTFALTVKNNIRINGLAGGVSAVSFSGAGTLNCDSLIVGTSIVPTVNSTTTLTLSIGAINITKDAVLQGFISPSNKTNTPTINHSTGTLTLGGNMAAIGQKSTGATYTMATGTGNGILNLTSTSPSFTLNSSNPSGTVTFTVNVNGVNSMVYYSGNSNQTIATTYQSSKKTTAAATTTALAYRNLTVSGGANKTFNAALTVNGNLNIDTLTTLTPAAAYTNTIANVNLNGGTLASGTTTGFTATYGTLTLLKNSSINLGTGVHQLNFSASNALTWNTNAMLTINGWQGTRANSGTAGKILIGTTNAGLTLQQVSGQIQIPLSGINLPGIQLATGEVVPINVGNVRYCVVNNGNWSSFNSWSTTSGATGGVLAGASVPVDGDTVYVDRGNTIIVDIPNATCQVVYLGGTGQGGTTGALTFAATGSPKLTVSNSMNIGMPGATNRTGTVTMVSGSTMVVDTLVMGGTGATPAAGTLTMTGGGEVIINKTIAIRVASTFTAGTGTMTLNSTFSLPTTVFTAFNNLNINAGQTVTSGVSFSVAGTMNVAGTFVPGATTHVISGAAGTITGTGTIRTNLVSATALSTQYTIATKTLNNLTVDYAAAGNQSMLGTGVTYGNIITSGSGIKTVLTPGLTVNGNITIGNGTTLAGSTFTTSLKGDWVNNGTFTAGTSTITFNGTNAQNINGASATTFSGLTLNNAAGLTLNGSVGATISGALTLTSGLFTPGSNTLTVTSTGSIAGASASSYVNGALSRGFINTSTAVTLFPVGKGGNYRPVNFQYPAAPGTKTVTIEQFETGSPLSIPSANPVRFGARYWNIVQSASGTAYKVGLNDGGVTPAGTVVMLRRQGTASTASNATTFASATYTNTNNFATDSLSADVSLAETSLQLTITGAVTANKVYDGTNTAPISSGVLNGVVPGDDVTLNLSAVFNNKNVGTGKSITSTSTLGGTNAGAYTLVQPTLTARDITPLSINISASASNKIYDGTTTASVTFGDNRISGDVLTVSGTAAFSDKNVGDGKNVSVSGIGITGTDAGNYTLGNTTASTTANVTARSLTVTATGQNKTYDGTATATVTYGDNRIAGDVLTVSGTAAFSDKNVGTGKTVSVSGIGITGTDAGNYTLGNTTTTSTANITARSLTVTATGQNKTYDGTTTATVTYGDNRIAGDVLTVSGTATFSDKNVGTGKTVSVSGIGITGTDAGNYTLGNTTATSTANITSRSLTVTATGQNKTYDGTTTATVTYGDNRIAGDVLTVSGTAAFSDKNVGVGKSVSVSGIGITGTDAANYTLGNTTTTATANITARSLTVTATGQNKTYDGTTTATVTYGDNRIAGDVLTVSGTAAFSDKNVGTGKAVSVSGIGITGTDTVNYTLGNTTTSTTANITAIALTITGVSSSKTYDGATSSANVPTITSGLIQTGDVAAFTQTYDDKNVGTGKTMTPSGVVTDGNSGNNYTYTFLNSTNGTITSRALTVTGAANTKTYDATTTSATNPNITSGALQGSDVAAFTQTYDDKNVGTGKTMTPSGVVTDGNSGNNYTYTFVNSTNGTITARALTITGASNSKTYDATTTSATNPTITSGAPQGSDVAAFTQTYDNKNVGTGKTMTPSGVVTDGNSGNNYTYTFVNSTNGTITGRALTITGASNSKTYDATTTSATNPTITSGALQGSDVAAFTQTYDNKNVGTGKTMTPSGVVTDGNSGNNYTYTFLNSTNGTITARALTITGAANSKIYDATTTSATNPTITSGALQGSDFAAFTQTYNNKNVGTGKTMTPSGVVTDGNSGNNYTYTFVNSTNGVITARALTVTGAANTKIYDGTTSSLTKPTITSGALQTGDVAAFTQTYDNRNAGTGKTMTPTGVVTDGNSGNNYTYTFVNSTNGVITKRAMTVTGAANTKIYDGTTSSANNPTITSGVIQTGDVAAFIQTYNNKNIGTGKTMTPSGVVSDGNSGNNYSYTFVNSINGTITRKALTITGANTSDKVYDGTTTASVTDGVLEGVVDGEVVDLMQAGNFNNANVGTAKPITSNCAISGLDAGNYILTQPVLTDRDITPADLTITALDTLKCAGVNILLGSIRFSTSGLIGIETIGSVTLSSAGSDASATAGSYDIEPSNATGGTFSTSNYNITYVNGSLVVNENDAVSVTLSSSESDNRICMGSTVTFTADGLNGGDDPIYVWKVNGAIAGTNSSSFTTDSLRQDDRVEVVMTSNLTTCISGSPAVSDPILMQVDSIPEIRSVSSVCLGSSVVLNATTSPDPSNAWSISNTSFASIEPAGNSVSILGMDTGTTDLTYTDVNGCIKTVEFRIKDTVPAPDSIRGPVELCGFYNRQTGYTDTIYYEITPVPGATSYDWIIPSTDRSLRIVKGFGTSRVGVIADSTLVSRFGRGYIYVASKTNGDCSSNYISIRLYRSIPLLRRVNGPVNVCRFVNRTDTTIQYNIDSAANVTGFVWVVPRGVSIVSGQGTSKLNVRFDNTFVNGSSISVTQLSNCGSRGANTLRLLRTNPTAPTSITGPVSICNLGDRSQVLSYSVPDIDVQMGYQWTLPPGMRLASGTLTGSTIFVWIDSSFDDSRLRVRSVLACGISAERTLFITTDRPSQPGLITGPSDACMLLIDQFGYNTNSNPVTYTIRKSALAQRYIWTLPDGIEEVERPGGIGTVNDTIIRVRFTSDFTENFRSLDSIQVQAVSCNIPSKPRSLIIRGSTTPVTPGVISGTRNVCELISDGSTPRPGGTTATYSIRRTSFTTSYIWTLPPGAILNSGNLNDTFVELRFDTSYRGGDLIVQSRSACGVSSRMIIDLEATRPGNFGLITASPGLLTGSCSGVSGRRVSYSVPRLSTNATSVQWSVPSGGTIVNGQGTTSILVDYGSTGVISGYVMVRGVNNCAFGNWAQRLVRISTPCAGSRMVSNVLLQNYTTEESIRPLAFPNPSTSTFSLLLPKVSESKTEVFIYNLQGMLVSKNIIPSGTKIFTMGEHLPKGTYMLKFIIDGKSFSEKIVKM